jgi:hypothetical protein
MELVKVILIPILTGLTAFLAHMAMAVFHDGIRPILPEFVEGRMKRTEAASVAFGLSVGFIASVGIAFTLSTNLLNPWLLFLPTDILGVMATRKHWAALLGVIWGALVVTCLSTINTVLTVLPVDFIGALGELSSPVVSGFALFPLVAIVYQFGWKKGLVAGLVTLVARLLTVKFTAIYPESIEIFVGMVLLIIFAIISDVKTHPRERMETVSLFEERTKRIQKNLPFLAAAGALIAVACNLHFFAGSEVSIYTLAEAYKAGTPEAMNNLINQAALSDFMRGLGFIPLIATTALATGVYGVVGLTFIYPIGYLAPNWIIAAIGGAVVITVEVFLLRGIGRGLQKFPAIQEASDNIRTAITTVMEFALLIGSILAVIKMGGYTGFFIGALIYMANDALGRPVMKLAIGPVAAIITGILLNLAWYLHIFTPIVAK